MRKKLDTRFPAARIKKIMQADEDVGKIALAVPVLVSKALELFLQDLCDRTYNVTLQRGMKTLNSLHLKQCVHGFNHYDFLRDIVSKVPDMGNNDAVPAGEDKPTRRRKATEDDESEEESKRPRTNTTTFHHPTTTNTTTNSNTNSSTGTNTGTGRGRGRPRGSGKGRRGTTRGTEDDPGTSPVHPEELCLPAPVRSFDLNLDVTENVPPAPAPTVTPTATHLPAPAPGPPAVTPITTHLPAPAPGPPAVTPTTTQLASADKEVKNEEYPGWSMDEIKKMAVDPVQFALAHQKVDEEEEDYDEDEG